MEGLKQIFFTTGGGGPSGGGGPVPWHIQHMPKSGPVTIIFCTIILEYINFVALLFTIIQL